MAFSGGSAPVPPERERGHGERLINTVLGSQTVEMLELRRVAGVLNGEVLKC